MGNVLFPEVFREVEELRGKVEELTHKLEGVRKEKEKEKFKKNAAYDEMVKNKNKTS